MIQLRLLGAIGLASLDGPVTGRAAQKRRLALLALLALAPARTLSRDKLIALLWPESETEHARHLLSVALYELRRALGEDALQSRGDDVELGPSVVTDVEQLEAAFRAGEPDAVLAALGGPLLDGFHLADSEEFEHWLEAERERFAQKCGAALEELAARRASLGDAIGAVEVWRRRAVLDPYNGRVALALMRALDAAGNRAGALQHARVHTLLLREEFGTEPDAALVEYAEQLRREPTPTAQSATASGAGAAPPTPHAATAPAAATPAAAESPLPAPSAPSELAGASLTAPAGPAGAGPPRRRRRLVGRLNSVRILAITAILLSLGGLVTVLLDREERGPRLSAAESVSIAVLPFRDLGGGVAQEKFGDGLGVVMIQALSSAGLRVAPFGSAFQFRGDVDARTVAAALNVGHVLEGTFQHAGDSVQIIAHLVNAEGNRVLWSEEYTRPWAHQDVLRLQEEIARAVVAALQVQLAPAQAERPLVRASLDDSASAHYIEGIHAMHRRTVPDLGAALEHFQRAVGHDPGFARAHAGIAEVHTLLGAYDYGVLPPKHAYPAARAAAERALALDPQLAEAHAALANVNFNYEWDWAGAEREFREAMRLNRGFASAWAWYSLLKSARGEHERAIEATRMARELDPVALVLRSALGRTYYYARQFDDAIAGFTGVINQDSTFLTAHLGLGLTYVVSGRVEAAIRQYEMARGLPGGGAPVLAGLLGHAYGLAGRTGDARAELQRLELAAARGYVPAEYRVLVHLGLGDHDRAIAALEEAVQNRSGGIAYLKADPILDPIRDDPRFQAIVRRAGL